MKLTGALKKKADAAATRDAIAQAGMELDDDELSQVAGGWWRGPAGGGGGGSSVSLREGQTVRVVEGIYKGCTGVVEKIAQVNRYEIKATVRLADGQVIEFSLSRLKAEG